MSHIFVKGTVFLKDTVLISSYWKAYDNWKSVSSDDDAFAEFVGKHKRFIKRTGSNMLFIQLPSEKVHRISSLLGPNYRAIIKIFLARRESQ